MQLAEHVDFVGNHLRIRSIAQYANGLVVSIGINILIIAVAYQVSNIRTPNVRV